MADESTGEVADNALRKSLELAPKTLDFRLLRGPALARLGRFDDAAQEFAAAVPAKPELGLLYTRRQAFALLGARDIEAYRQLHSRLVAATAESKVLSTRIHGIGWMGALIPDAVEGFEESIKLVRDARAKVAADGKGELEDDNLIVLPYGAMLYRLKQYDNAADTLGRLSERLTGATDKESEYIRACAQYFLAMARYQLDHKFQARRLLDQARTTSDVLRSDPRILWHQRVVLDTLQREAKELIEP
jgi:tetratricopeptide (TPR) repeat protein